MEELYSILGRAKQAKTERYRGIYRHLQQSEDRFIPAPGEARAFWFCGSVAHFRRQSRRSPFPCSPWN